jgi:hypothetical protein
MWEWANDTMPEPARPQSERIKQLFETTQYKIFESPCFEVDPQDMDELSALAVVFLDASGIFKSKQADYWLFMAVNSNGHRCHRLQPPQLATRICRDTFSLSNALPNPDS